MTKIGHPRNYTTLADVTPARQIGVFRRPGQRSPIGATEIFSQSNRCTHGESPLFATGIQNTGAFGIPKVSQDLRKQVLLTFVASVISSDGNFTSKLCALTAQLLSFA